MVVFFRKILIADGAPCLKVFSLATLQQLISPEKEMNGRLKGDGAMFDLTFASNV